MNRTVEWDQWKARRQERMRDAARLAEALSQSRRAGSSRKRSPEEAEMLTRMALVECARREAEGRLVRIGPREYELHPRVK